MVWTSTKRSGMKRITTVTVNPALDISAEVPEFITDTKLRCGQPRYDPGGGGINVARAIHILGGDALALFCAGGPAGDKLVEMVKAEGVRAMVLAINGVTRQNFAVTEAASRHQYRFVMPGPELTHAEVEKLLAEIRNILDDTDYLVISGGLTPGAPDDLYARLIRNAKKAGVRVILDVTGPPFEAALHEGPYLVRTNRTDFKQFTGVWPQEPEDVAPFFADWLAKGWAEVVVITLSGRGTILTTSDRCVEILPPAVQRVSAVGAGDSFVAGMTQALAQGWGLDDAAAYGTAALLSALETAGTELCRKPDVEKYFRQMTAKVRR